jgi:polyisoprenoid-binding protein YceI
MSITAIETIPGYTAGTWSIDPVHSEIGFSVRHMMVSKVRGKFTTFEGEIVTAENPLDSTVTAKVDVTSIDTGNTDRDDHLRGADFFEVESNAEMTFRSTGLRPATDGFLLAGDLTLKGVTKPVELKLELNGVGPDAYGGTRIGFSALGEINRKDFGVDFSAAMETGGVVVGDKVTIQLEVEGVLNS